MASIEMVQIDPSWILSPVTPSSSSKLSSLNATLNSPAEGPVPSFARAPTIEDLNQLNTKLMKVQLSSAQELKDEEFPAHNIQGGERHGFVQNCSVGGLSRFRRDGGTPILLDFTDAIDLSAYFHLPDDTSADEANKTPSPTVDGEVHSSGDDATARELPLFRRNGGDRMGLGSSHIDLTPYLHSGTSIDEDLTEIKSRL